jgi:hypothetical protein
MQVDIILNMDIRFLFNMDIIYDPLPIWATPSHHLKDTTDYASRYHTKHDQNEMIFKIIIK